MEQLLVLLIPACIIWSWLNPIGFVSRKIEGTVIQVLSIPLLARMKRHAVPAVITLIVTIALTATNIASALWLAVWLASSLGLLAVPQAYTVTTRGIRVGRGNFRRWTEFAGVHRSPAGAMLQTIRPGPGMPIWLAGSRGDDEFVHLLRSLIRNSYKGKSTPFPATAVNERGSAESPDIPNIAAFTHDH
jgi:uncharacterized protein (DUF58 family)